MTRLDRQFALDLAPVLLSEYVTYRLLRRLHRRFRAAG